MLKSNLIMWWIGAAAATATVVGITVLDPFEMREAANTTPAPTTKIPATVDATPGAAPAPAATPEPASSEAEAEAEAEVAALPSAIDAPEAQPVLPQLPPVVPEPAAQPEATAPAQNAPVAQPSTADLATSPRFDLLRAEPDGSLVVAGTAPTNSRVDIITGSRVLAETMAGPTGDFAVVLEEPLAPGDYQIVLRATGADGSAAMSTETAVVAIPEQGSNQVLALVEQPGAPSRLITVPEAGSPMLAAVVPADTQPEPTQDIAATTPEAPAAAEAEVATDSQAPASVTASAPAEPQPAAAVAGADLRIEAVEIDGGTVFVAGAATPGARVRVYANDILLGDTTATAEGRFLVEVRRDLPVGDYIMRADTIDPATANVLARISVPFVRSEGERLAAIAVPPPPTLPAAAPTIAFAAAAQDVSPSQGGVDVPQSLGVLQGPPTIQVESNALVPTAQSVIIRKGDTLWQLSRRVYGRGVKYTTIYTANAGQIGDPNRIFPGQVFTVPNEGDADDTALERHQQLRKAL